MTTLFSLLLVIWLLWIQAEAAYQGYSSNTLMYNPRGEVEQIKYAKQAVRSKGGPVICLKTSDHEVVVVCLSETANMGVKSGLVVEGSNRGKLHFLDDDQSLVLSVTGLGSDANALVDTSRRIVRDYRATYGCTIPPKALASNLADILHSQTRRRGSRPLAVAAAVAGYDEDAKEPQLYSLDAEGGCCSVHATFLGGGEWMRRSGGRPGYDCLDQVRGDLEDAMAHSGSPHIDTQWLLGRIKAHFLSPLVRARQELDRVKDSEDEEGGEEEGDGKEGDAMGVAMLLNVRIKIGTVSGGIDGRRNLRWEDINDDDN